MAIPLVDLVAQDAPIRDEALAEISRIARDGHFVLGSNVERFEHWLADTCGRSFAITVASGTDALELGLRALGIGAGDAVVTSAFSFVAAAEAISATGARPVFCDVEPDTLCASVRTVSSSLERCRGLGLVVKAIVPVHLFGVCANLTELAALAKSEQAALVEDAAQSLGARDSSGCIAGGMGEVGCFSFFPTKPLGAWGDGGAIVTDDDAVAQRLRRLRVHGAISPYIHETIGRNSRLDSIQAAVLWVKSRHLASWQRQRAYRATRYLEAFDGLPVLLPATAPAPALHAWHAFVIRVERDRDKLAAWLACRGVASRVYYPLGLHQQPCFLHLGEPSLPNSEMACQTALAIPISAALTDAEQDIVIEAVQSFFRC